MQRPDAREAGFTLLETVVCVGIIAIVTLAATGAMAAIARNAEPGAVRALALMQAENAIVRARVATSYARPASAATDARGLAWALAPGTHAFVVAGKMMGPVCGATAAVTVPLAVTTTFDGAASFRVVVAYPLNPCTVTGVPNAADTATAATVELDATLPNPVYAPGTQIPRAILDPSLQ
jgi:prepilin-type N-terminal cleavage/methylation domain-containing protein